MTSQTWRTEKEVDKPVWKHFLQIYRPPNAKPGIAMLWIDGGNNSGRKPSASPLLLNIAKDSNTIVAELRQIPSEPLKFADENGKSRSEDAIIAYTWDKWLRGGDDNWPLRLPMTKASVRGMDTVTAFLKTKEGGEINIDRFIVGGASKRGWTTWTTAAVDKRVVAVIPCVIDMLNLVPSFVNHWRSLGAWSVAIQDYTDIRMQDWFNTKKFKELMKIEEPFEYRDRLTMPKLLINAAGDEYFLSDSSQFYYSKLKGDNRLRYMPNTGHRLEPVGVVQSVTAFIDAIQNNRPRPEYSWKIFKSDGSIEVKSKQAPKTVKVWQITNPKARDFRLMTIGPKWTAQEVTLTNGRYKTDIKAPAAGWTAFLVELTYDSGGKHPHTFTSEVSILPRTYPFPSPKPGDGLPPKK